jgi:hypothetical protein
VAGLTARKKMIDWIKLEDSNQYERRSKEDLQNNSDNVANNHCVNQRWLQYREIWTLSQKLYINFT